MKYRTECKLLLALDLNFFENNRVLFALSKVTMRELFHFIIKNLSTELS